MKTKSNVLVVDDESSIRRILQAAFEKQGMRTLVAESAEDALSLLESETVQCVLTDVTMPGIGGYELQRRLAHSHPDLPVVIMTAYGTIPQAVQAIREGAFEYVPKPFDLNSLIKIVKSAISGPSTRPKSRAKRAGPRAIIAEAPNMRAIVELAEQVADSRATVLINGESGVGKEVLAKYIHELSPRASERFVAVSCAALPETLLESELFGYDKGAFTGAQAAKLGRFELAHEGTLFLDEVGEIPPAIQVKLLRVLQEREFERLGSVRPTKVDVRVITATNRNLQTEVEAGRFRLDLLYRLQVVDITIPPLRDRVADVAPLAETFLARFSEENGRSVKGLAPETLEVMTRYPWPGNVRELENAMERATVLAPKSLELLTPDLLPPQVLAAG